LLPVLQQRDRSHDKRRRQRGVAFERPRKQYQKLKGLAQPHAVGEHSATAMLGRLLEEVLEPGDARELVVLEFDTVAQQAGWQVGAVRDAFQDLATRLGVVRYLAI
jgi:hypothetical protein